jgi:hypothetical protein
MIVLAWMLAFRSLFPEALQLVSPSDGVEYADFAELTKKAEFSWRGEGGEFTFVIRRDGADGKSQRVVSLSIHGSHLPAKKLAELELLPGSYRWEVHDSTGGSATRTFTLASPAEPSGESVLVATGLAAGDGKAPDKRGEGTAAAGNGSGYAFPFTVLLAATMVLVVLVYWLKKRQADPAVPWLLGPDAGDGDRGKTTPGLLPTLASKLAGEPVTPRDSLAAGTAERSGTRAAKPDEPSVSAPASRLQRERSPNLRPSPPSTGTSQISEPSELRQSDSKKESRPAKSKSQGEASREGAWKRALEARLNEHDELMYRHADQLSRLQQKFDSMHATMERATRDLSRMREFEGEAHEAVDTIQMNQAVLEEALRNVVERLEAEEQVDALDQFGGSGEAAESRWNELVVRPLSGVLDEIERGLLAMAEQVSPLAWRLCATHDFVHRRDLGPRLCKVVDGAFGHVDGSLAASLHVYCGAFAAFHELSGKAAQLLAEGRGTGAARRLSEIARLRARATVVSREVAQQLAAQPLDASAEPTLQRLRARVLRGLEEGYIDCWNERDSAAEKLVAEALEELGYELIPVDPETQPDDRFHKVLDCRPLRGKETGPILEVAAMGYRDRLTGLLSPAQIVTASLPVDDPREPIPAP